MCVIPCKACAISQLAGRSGESLTDSITQSLDHSFIHSPDHSITHSITHSLNRSLAHSITSSSLAPLLTGLIALSAGSTLLISDVGNDSRHRCHRMMSSKGSFQLSATTTGMAPTLNAWGEREEGRRGMERGGATLTHPTDRRTQR